MRMDDSETHLVVSNNCAIKKKNFPAEKEYESGTPKFGLQKKFSFLFG